MNWLVVVTIAYFLIALEVILDKFLLSSKRVSHPAIYTFYSGILSFLTILLFPFGLHSINFSLFLWYLSAGIIFAYGIFSLFYAIQKSEASRVTPVVGAVIPIMTSLFSFFILKEILIPVHLAGVLILIIGGLLISWEFSKDKKRNFFEGFRRAILAGVLLALSYTITKSFYEKDTFFNVFIWTRMGVTIGALSLLLFSPWRKVILSSLKNFRKPQKEHKHSGFLFIVNKALGGVGSILVNFSISLGSVTVINALISLEYAFVFILGGLFSLWMPKIFKERINLKNAVQKISAIVLITIGIVLVSNFK